MDQSPIYCIPGLGVNEKVFAKIRIPGRRLHHLPWLEPERGESMQGYARRMAAQIPENGPVDLMGLSFGGVMSVEISHVRPVRRIVLLSSIKSRNEKPTAFKVMRVFPVYITNISFLRDRTTWLWGRFFGLNSKKDIKMFYKLMPGLSDHYMRWSVRQMCRWKREEAAADVFHIHGDRDLIFPMKHCDAHEVIEGGTHAMVFTHASQISRLIEEKLK